MAYADQLAGPWRVHGPGVLPKSETGFDHHIASPDVVIDHSGTWRMYFHGRTKGSYDQTTRLALSDDGLNWTVPAKSDVAPFYLRVIQVDRTWHGVAKNLNESLVLMRSSTGEGVWERGPELVPGGRHVALERVGDRLLCYFSRIGDAPESVLVTAFDLSQSWERWTDSLAPEKLVLKPRESYEGIEHRVVPSESGSASGVQQVRDPYVFTENGRRYLFYAVAGEEAIAGAELLVDIN